MSQWINVYCHKRLRRLEAHTLEHAVRRGWEGFADLYASFHVTKLSARGEPWLFHLQYTPAAGQRQVVRGKPVACTPQPPPIVLHRSRSRDEAGGQAQEFLEEYFARRRGKAAQFVRGYLAHVVDVYSFCLKASHLENDLGRSLAITAAHRLADRAEGLVRDEEDHWLRCHPRYGLCPVQ